MLCKQTTDLDKKSKGHTMLEAMPDLSVLDTVPSPRLTDTHIQYKYLPKKHIEIGAKIVHMIRNPKDVCVSLYHHAQKDIFLNVKCSWEEFFGKWMAGESMYESGGFIVTADNILPFEHFLSINSP